MIVSVSNGVNVMKMWRMIMLGLMRAELMLGHSVKHIFGYPSSVDSPHFNAIYQLPHFGFVLPVAMAKTVNDEAACESAPQNLGDHCSLNTLLNNSGTFATTSSTSSMLSSTALTRGPSEAKTLTKACPRLAGLWSFSLALLNSLNVDDDREKIGGQDGSTRLVNTFGWKREGMSQMHVGN